MATKLSSITAQYRSFVNDQVLTADQLNDLIQYFEDQGRLSRVFLDGVGIVCGFKVSLAENKEITVSQGCGVTTDGDLIVLQQPIPEKTTRDIDVQEIKFALAKEFKDTNVKYEPFLTGEDKLQIQLYELLPSGTTKSTDNFAIGDIPGLGNMVALLYLEEFSKPPELCTAIDCNNQGNEEISRLKVLLCSIEDATVINKLDPIYTKHAILDPYLELPDVAVQRVVLNNSDASNQSNLAKSFHKAISSNNTTRQLKNGMISLFSDFKSFLKLPSTVNAEIINSLIDQKLGFSASAIPDDVQYRYDLLKDLVDTYNEIKALLLELNSECCPSIHSFPKHLMIGRLTASADSEPFRHSYYKTPVSGNDNQNISTLNSLIIRFFLMLSNYGITGKEIKITPSKTKVLLGKRSIPYYFQVNGDLIDNWDFSKTIRLMQKNNLCYFTENLSDADPVQNPLKYNLDAFDFFRIEGHLGMSSGIAEPKLASLITSKGLDFNLISFDIDKDQAELQLFINKNTSIEHLAGAPKGGTFILLSKAGSVFADYALSYKYKTEQTFDCNKIQECNYPWISSLKYLNNLSRSMKGTQSKIRVMPKYYILYVINYSINDVALISRPVEIRIPMADVFNRRLHVVIEKLNERFPTGLVFDFNQEKKKLIIKKLKDDTFTFMVKDLTLTNNSPYYTYTEKGFLRNGKMFRGKGIMCTELRTHNKNFYQNLHATDDPKGKDDDYGRYNEKWKKWSNLIEKLMTNPFFTARKQNRIITAFGELSGSIREELRPIITEITQLKAKAFLSGEWVNGTWVDSEMLSYYTANSKNTHDDIVLFIKLRGNLHQRWGKSRFAIFVTGITDEQLTTLQNKYISKADFYSGKVEGATFIQLV